MFLIGDRARVGAVWHFALGIGGPSPTDSLGDGLIQHLFTRNGAYVLARIG